MVRQTRIVGWVGGRAIALSLASCFTALSLAACSCSANSLNRNPVHSAKATSSTTQTTQVTQRNAQRKESENCPTTVSAPDGFINVRQAPSSSSPIVRNLLDGWTLEVVQQRSDWVQISRPVQGWVAANGTKKSCFTSGNPQLKFQAIDRLGEQASRGDLKAAENLVKLLTDGAMAEAQAAAIDNWAEKNPRFLITVLDRQPQEIRIEMLEHLDFYSEYDGSTSRARQNFEAALKQQPSNSPTARDWKTIGHR